MSCQRILHFRWNLLEDLAVHDAIRLQLTQLLNQDLFRYGGKLPAEFSVSVSAFEQLVDDHAFPATAEDAHQALDGKLCF